MKHADRLARSGAVYTARETIRRERPFGLTLLGIIIAVISALVLSRACASVPVNALVVSSVPAVAGSTPSTGNSDHELLLPFISFAWPPPPVLSNCTSEEPTCN